MAPRSPVSSEPLSSSSLSPPPQQRRTAPAKAVKGLAKAATAEDSSDLSELSDEDEDDTVRRRVEAASAATRTRRRGALIPEDMWDWAYKKKPTSSRSVSAHHRDDDDEEDESDEDEDNEEEQDDGEDDEEEQEEQGSPPAQSAPAAHPSSSQATTVANARASPTALAPSRRGRSAVSSDRASREMHMSASEEEEEEEDAREEGEIDEHSDTEQQRTAAASPSSRNKPTTTTPKRARIRDEDEDDDIDGDPTHDAPPPEDDGTEDEDDHTLIAARTKRDSSSAPITPLTNGHGDGEDDDDDGQSAAASDDASIDIEWATQVKPSRPHPDWDDSPDFSFLPRRHAIARTRLLARHADLIAAEDAEEPEAQDELGTTRKLANDEGAALTLVGAALALAEASLVAKADSDATPPEDTEPVVAPVDEDAEVEVEVEGEGEVEAISEDEEDEEAEDALEADTDLQPPQRAEALDILAGMEVKFAILRERIYIDKMEEIAAEEAMILNGTHPELLHFLTTLSQRKERRTKLASLRRDRDKEWIHKKRKADEDAIWSWWRVQKDGLRDDMVAEVNGKRRKLEREKRSLDNRVNGAHFITSFRIRSFSAAF
jgi:hypothetical protein